MSTPANFNGAKPIIDPANAAMLLIDHQSGLFQTIQDMPFTEVRTNATILAKVASLAKIPVITSASVPQGPNGPLIPEIHKYATRAVRRPPRRDQRLGQPRVCDCGEGHPQEAAHHRRHHHQRVHGLPQHRRRA
jgi:nicotinamidase-related amidase